MCSDGAVLTARAGRGNRIDGKDEKDYEIFLPTLPTGRVVLNTLFLHSDVRERPYRVEDFRDALATAGVLPDVVALGAYQINHVWAVSLTSGEATKKLAAMKEWKVKGRRCVIIDPEDQQVKLRLHWMLYGVQDEDIRKAFAAFGNVTEVTRERWRVQGMREKGSTTRSVLLKLKPGVKVDDLPHQVRVAGELALVVVPGRAMQCLRCHGTGHVRRDCRVPRCSKCRRYGHVDADCVRTYASATGLPRADEHDELMDVVEAEEAAQGTNETNKQRGPQASSSPSGSEPSTVEAPAAGPAPVGDTGKHVAATPVKVSCDSNVATEATTKATVCSAARQAGELKSLNEPLLEKSGAPSSNSVAASKRPHPQASNSGADTEVPGVEEPPAKTAQGRRPSLRPRPNLTADKRVGNGENVGQGPTVPPDDNASDGAV
ncbi:uncharacterized protein LOC142783773 [Rhipicephalus microplus]|uniref:uncharacterized protein LOC142783773 n=1 Tax=Rhipicephalus microplus TaxID=6941 RepID=UPI003F6CB9CF